MASVASSLFLTVTTSWSLEDFEAEHDAFLREALAYFPLSPAKRRLMLLVMSDWQVCMKALC